MDTAAAPPPPSLSVDLACQHVRTRKPRRERKAACTACKQQKLKCDAHTNPDKPCSRCSRLSLSCFQSPGFQRLEVRKSQKQQVDPDEGGNIHLETQEFHENACSSAISGIGCESNVVPRALANMDDTESPLLYTYASCATVSAPDQSDLTSLTSTSTNSRSLSDIHVQGKIIDECFQIFFSSYSPLLPIFLLRLIPNECYDNSLTLFWAIVAVGSRSLILDPTLLRSLAPEVLNLALTSFQLRRNRIDDIRGLLILCTWPCPSSTLLKDNTVALSSLLLSLSMQAGLHVPSSRFALSSGPGSESHSNWQLELASLWAHVVISCQSTMSLGGYPSLVCFTNSACCSFEKTSWQFVPHYLKLRYKTQAVLSESESIINELGLDAGLTHEQNDLSARTNPLKNKLNELEVEFSSSERSPLDAIYVQIARLQLEVLQLYCDAEANNQNELIHLFCTASGLIISIKNLNDSTNIASYSPSYLGTGLSLAGFTLLRMMKSRFVEILDPVTMEKGKSSIFVAIHLLKQMSLANNDLYAKSAEYLSTMWTNRPVFKILDPTRWWKLRIRNRLSMSVVFDSILIWVENYGACNDSTTPLLQRSNGLGSFRGSSEDFAGHPISFSSDDRWLYELDWNAGLDVLMAE